MTSVTIREVAEEAQVSISSVSRILRGTADYSFGVETQERVRAAAQRLGYQAHAAARMLRQQEKTLVGLVARLSVMPHQNEMLVAVRDEIRSHGYESVLIEPEQLMPARSNSPFPSLEMLAGLISLDLSMELEMPAHYRDLSRRMPLVGVYPITDSGVETYSMDMACGVGLAVEHLVGLGHRRIAFAKVDNSPHPSDYRKVQGWEAALRAFPIEQDARCAIPIYVGMPITEMAATLCEGICRLDPRPTALICSSDEVALCVLGRLNSWNWRLPQDLLVIGFDGIYFGAYSNPALTSVAKPCADIARLAVDRLVWRISEGLDAAPVQETVKPTLVQRGSTAPVPRHGTDNN